MDRGARWATAHSVTKSRTGPKQLAQHSTAAEGTPAWARLWNVPLCNVPALGRGALTLVDVAGVIWWGSDCDTEDFPT